MTTVHAHDRPVFGCADCVKSDREAWANREYHSWLKTYKSPRCKGCGGETKPWEYTMKNDEVKVSVGCIKFDAAEGSIPCAEYDFEVRIA